MINFVVFVIKNFEMFTYCFIFLLRLCNIRGDQIVFPENNACREMTHA